MMLFFFSSRRRHTRLQGDGVQTCALPISRFEGAREAARIAPAGDSPEARLARAGERVALGLLEEAEALLGADTDAVQEIGRASCRERVESSVAARGLRDKKSEKANSRSST